MTKVEERLADALAARADAVQASSVRPLADARLAGPDRGPRRSWWLAPVAAAASVAIVAAVVAVVAGRAPSSQVNGSTRPIAGVIDSVSAVSAHDVWAVGWQATRPASNSNAGIVPFIVHWDGTKWQRVKAPPELHDVRLTAVAGSSPDDVWAVGYSVSHYTGLILHWNGQSWRQVPFAADGRFSLLSGVTVLSATDAWAVGAATPRGGGLIMHWNGLTWTRVGVPSVARRPATYLIRAAAVSADDIWAVGVIPHANVALHWDGRTWSAVRLPNLHSAWLDDVAAGPGGTVWASSPVKAVMIRWNGTAWQRVRGPDVPANESLWLAVAGPDSVWATGAYTGSAGDRPVIFHWNGSSWTRSRLKLTGDLFAVTATSARSAWAAGVRGRGAALTPIVLHWNGSTWRQVYGSATTRGLPQNCGPLSCSSTASGSGHVSGHG